MEELIKKCKCGVFLTVNEHRDYYMTAAKWLKELRGRGHPGIEDVSAELEETMSKTDTVYELHFYPETPISFYNVFGTSLAEVLNKANNCLL